MSFTGFPERGLLFLTTLGSKNRDWFQEHKKEYDADVAQPAKDFVDAMTELLQDRISPLVIGQAKTNGSIAPINNDLRFNPDAPPYKDHLLMKWWEGDDKKLAPTLWVRLSEVQVGFASGMMLADLDRWRRSVGDDSGVGLAAALSKLDKRYDIDVAGQALKKVPKPWPEDHPRGDLLRHKMFQVRWSEPTPTSASSARFAAFCADRLALLGDVHGWLRDNLT